MSTIFELILIRAFIAADTFPRSPGLLMLCFANEIALSAGAFIQEATVQLIDIPAAADR